MKGRNGGGLDLGETEEQHYLRMYLDDGMINVRIVFFWLVIENRVRLVISRKCENKDNSYYFELVKILFTWVN
jgi:hypothetical protein